MHASFGRRAEVAVAFAVLRDADWSQGAEDGPIVTDSSCYIPLYYCLYRHVHKRLLRCSTTLEQIVYNY